MVVSGWAGRTRGRMIMLFWLFSFMYVLLVARLAQVQYFQSGRYAAMAQAQHEGNVEVPALRGEIRDHNNVVLAQSLALWSVAVDPSKADQSQVAQQLAELLGKKPEKLQELMTNASTFAWLARKVPDEVAAKVTKLGLSGVFLLREPTPGKRFYPKGRLASHLLGATGIDEQGLDGLEASYDKYLGGSPGLVRTFMDRDGWAIPATAQGLLKKPIPGRHLRLTLDESIQYVAQRELNKAVTDHKAKGGICIVMDVHTGGILALAVSPDFPADQFGNVPPALRRDRAITDPYEPGSTFKVFTASAALNAGVKPNDHFEAGGPISVGGWTINNAEGDEGAGFESLADIVAFSLNVGTATVAMHIGKKALGTTLDNFGFGQPTGVDLEGEEPGILAPWKTWADISLATISFGQGVAVTPMQLVSGLQAIANKGVRLKPHVVDAVLNPDGTDYQVFKPKVLGRPVSEAVSKQMIEILEGVVAKGTGKNAKIHDYVVAGKTGTAQVSEGGGYGGHYIASFLGMAPAEDPRIVCLVKVEHPQGIYYGGVVSAPVFSKVVQEALWKLGVRPSSPADIIAAKQGEEKHE